MRPFLTAAILATLTFPAHAQRVMNSADVAAAVGGPVATLAIGDLRRQGWKGDGTTDDSAAFIAALAALPATGGEIVIPYSAQGTSLCNITVAIPVTIRGSGGPYGQTTLRPSTKTCTMFDVTAPFVTFDNLSFAPLTGKQTAGTFIKVEASAARFRADRLMMADFHEGITVTGNVPSVELTRLRGFLYTSGTQSSAFLHFQGGLDVRVSNVTANGPGKDTLTAQAGVWIEALGDGAFSNMDLIGMGTSLLVTPGTGQEVDSLWVTDSFLDSGYRGADLAPTGTGLIQRSRLSNVWASSHAAEGIRILPGVNGLDIDGLHGFANGADGVALAGGKNVHLRGGQIAGNTGNGVSVAAAVSDWSVKNATVGIDAGFLGNQGFGVAVTAGASDRYQITGNTMTGNVLGAMQDSGTGAHKTVWGNPGDPYDYTAARDVTSGFLKFSGRQASYSGYIFATDDGTERFRISATGVVMQPGNTPTPASGLALFVDPADGKLKTKNAAGVVAVLAGQ